MPRQFQRGDHRFHVVRDLRTRRVFEQRLHWVGELERNSARLPGFPGQADPVSTTATATGASAGISARNASTSSAVKKASVVLDPSVDSGADFLQKAEEFQFPVDRLKHRDVRLPEL